MIKYPLRHKHDLLAISKLVGRQWITCGDVERMTGIPAARAKSLLAYLVHNGLAQKKTDPHGHRRFGPIGDA